MSGKVYIGKCLYDSNRKRTDPNLEEFENIVVLTKTTCNKKEYFNLSPYYLKDKHGYLMENIWQFSKVYSSVRKVNNKYPNGKPIWSHPEEVHFQDGKLTDEYFAWRQKGFENPEPVRYPNSYHGKRESLFSLKRVKEDMTEEDIQKKKLTYIEARKKIYLPLYSKLVRKEKIFDKLKEKLENGTNLLIVEVDGPCYESLDYYKEKYNIKDDFIQDIGGGVMEATERNIKLMLNDSKHSFGHGYCLAMNLLDKEEEWNE